MMNVTYCLLKKLLKISNINLLRVRQKTLDRIFYFFATSKIQKTVSIQPLPFI